MTFTWSVNSASLVSVSESFASLACTLFPASISSLFSFARSSASVAISWVSPCSLARLDCSCCSVSLRRFFASSRERSSSASASHGKMQTRPTRSRADRNLSSCGSQSIGMRHAPWPFQPIATTAERYGRIKAKRLQILNLAVRRARSGAMIGVAGQDGDRAIDLLGENDAGEAVRQGHTAEATARLSALDEAVGPRPSAPPIRKARPCAPPSRNLARTLAKAFAVERIAAQVETDRSCARRAPWREALALRPL